MTASEADTLSDRRQPALREVPQPGRVVEVRGATWAVADVKSQGLQRSPADETQARTQHVVTLQSLDEDRLGEELSVVWELEVGQTVVPDQGLPETISPEAFDDPNTLGAFVDAVRWGALTSADTNSYQAPFRSGANVEAYQLEPLRRALQSPRTNLLLADDVGLGKTIEAGLVIQELLLRHRARTVVIVCPPSLALKWQDEMREKFGLDFVIVNSERRAEVRRTHGLAANPFRLFPRVIVSMAWLPTPAAQRLLRSVYDGVGRLNSARRFAFDVLVVDEAHHVAPSSPSAVGGGRGYAVDSQRTMATRALAEKCEHRLFLSATPHNGHSESFTALLEMIDNRRFSRGATVDEQALKAVIVRRLKTDIKDKSFLPRQIKTIPFTPTADEVAAFDQLVEVLERSARANGRRKANDIVALLLKKRFLSSPWAFAQTLALYESARATGGQLAITDDYYAEVIGSEQSDEEEGATEHPEFGALRQTKATDPLTTDDTKAIRRLVAWGDGYEHKLDSRVQALLLMLDGVCRPDGRTWSNERVVIFTEYTATLAWVVGLLKQHGYSDVIATIQGSTPAEEREQIRARFTAPPNEDPVRVLVATDAAGEGIDLQGHCHRLINLDVPFNPSRLEQRIGRIDRYGQRFAPEIYYLAATDSTSTYAADVDFLRRIAEKVSTVASDLGSVNPVIDAEIQSHFGGASVAPAPRKPTKGAAAVNKSLAGEQELNAQLTELARTYGTRKEALHLTAMSSRRVVDTALALSGQPTLRERGDEHTDAEVLEIPSLGSGWHKALEGLDTRLRPGIIRAITFDDQAAKDRTDIVHVHLGHALLQKSARILRNSLFGSDSRVHRVTAVVVPDLDYSCVAAVSRLVLVGRGGLRLHEEVFLTGIRIKGNAMAEDKVNDLLDRALDGADLELADDPVRRALVKRWNADGSRMHARLTEAMSRRAERRQKAVTDQLDERRDADIERARQIFAAFRTNLNESLRTLKNAEDEREFMLALPDDQRDQRRRDIARMDERLSTLSEEERREVQALRDRYAEVQPYVSAAAVVFAVTPQDAAEMGGDR
ncbi:MAG: DISARM system SNF2-like helicase DrmD [Humibacillus sp.]|nr:DISARM system SNF2-like helicase DrmD [Humibacillus sp.]MDN5775639.1 DISARM system SNF2-like helicase DrmD [Humibacillus sp.]